MGRHDLRDRRADPWQQDGDRDQDLILSAPPVMSLRWRRA